MAENQSGGPLLTLDEVQSWAVERQEALARVAELDRKLQGVRLLFPDLAAKLFGTTARPLVAPAGQTARGAMSQAARDALPLHKKAITDVIPILLEDENGGRVPRWFRDRMLEIPGLAERVESNPTQINNSLMRLVRRGKLKRSPDGKYYLPQVYERLERGELEDDGEAERGSGTSFNALMHEAMREYGKPFKAADAVAIAERVPELAERLREQPSRVYSWLSRELYRHKLVREGEFYRHPSVENEAPSGDAAGASETGRAATLPFENVVGFPRSR